MQGWVFALTKAAFSCAPLSPCPVTQLEVPQPSGIASASSPMFDAPWFHGSLPRTECEELLFQAGAHDGLFLTRESTSEPGKFVISVCYDSQYEEKRRFVYNEIHTCLLLLG
eukprot:m.444060 g.444060  ORF g.444060 m.444060 type:complete len:112 (-) comp20295_c6_seq3:119-454(-)